MSASKGENTVTPDSVTQGAISMFCRRRIDAKVFLIPFRKSFRVICPKEEPAESLYYLHDTSPLCVEVVASCFAGLSESRL